MKYQYTMKISFVQESALLSFMEGREMQQILEVPIEIESDLSEEEKIKDLESKIGTKTPDGLYEFAGYKNLVKVINLN